MIDIQGLIIYNPKTKEYLIRIGNLLFPFKTANEVLAYFLGKFKITKKLKQSFNRIKNISKIENELINYIKCHSFKNSLFPSHSFIPQFSKGDAYP